MKCRGFAMRVLPGIPVVLSHSVSVRCHTQSHGSTQRRNVLGTKFGCGRPVTCARNTDSSSRRDTTSHRRASHRVVRVSSAGSSEANARELGPPYQISEKTTLLADDSAGPEALVLSDGARQQLGGLTTSIFRYARSYQALFGYHVVNTGLQIWQAYSPGQLPLITEPEYSVVLNSTALVNYWLCFYFLDTCGHAFASISEEMEDSLPSVLKAVAWLTLTCNELTVVSWLFTLALIIEAAMIWDGTKYLMGALIFIFALVRVYGYGLVNKYYGELQDFVSAVLRDSKKPVQLDINISKTERVLLKVCLGPLAILGLEEEHEDVGDDTDGGYRFSETDLELFRSLSTAMFTTGVSYLVATSCTAVYYGASVAVGDDAEVVSTLYSVPEYLSQLLTGVLLLETTDSFVRLVNGRPYISQFMSACGKLENVFIGLTNITAAVVIGNVFNLFWGDEFTDDLAVSFDFAIFQEALHAIVSEPPLL